MTSTSTATATPVTSAARAGMADLIARLRALCDAGTAEYTVGSVSYFSDTQLQDYLDSHVTQLQDAPLAFVADTVGGGTVEWHRASTGYRDYEDTTSGTAYWVVRDAAGAVQATSGYALDPITGVVNFAANQGGTAYYLTARSYDLYAAAADVWAQRAAHWSNWNNFDADEGDMEIFKAGLTRAAQMEELMRSKAGQNRSAAVGIKTARFKRTDLA